MPSASYFSPPLPQGEALALLTADGRKRNKRKRSERDSPDDDAHSDSLDLVNQGRAPKAQLQAEFGRDDGEAYFTAGIKSPEELPGGDFPHSEGPIIDLDSTFRRAKSDLTAAKLRSSGYTKRSNTAAGSSGPKVKSSLHIQHLAVLNTIMHKCVLEGDFVRAGRAFGMILRARVNGQPNDIRAQGRWGIGGEILLRLDAQLASLKSGALESNREPDNSQDEEQQHVGVTDAAFTKEGFEKARNYYETLILSYPYRRAAPQALSSLHFYVIMFSLWIFQTQEQYMSQLSTCLANIDEESIENEGLESDSEFSSSPKRILDLQKASRNSVLQQAGMIGDRLDELLLSPPYSDDRNLWKLRGMVALWAGDLCVRKMPTFSGLESDKEGHSDSENGSEGPGGALEAILEHRKSMEAKQAHIEVANKAFKTVETLAGTKMDTTPQLFSATDP